MKKNFKNSFGVKGSPALIKAFAVKVELLGWKFDANGSSKSKSDIGVDPPNLWFCAYNNKALDLRPNHYWCDRGGSAQYILPQDWDKALKAASEVVEEIPEYVEAVMNLTGIEKGKIYPMKASTIIDGKFNDYTYNPSEEDKYFKPSTKEAFDAQNKPKFEVGEYYVNKNKNNPWTIFIVKSVYGSRINTYGYINTEVKAFMNPCQTTIYNDAPRLATPEEKQWLDACIKANKYLTKEEALNPVFKVGDWIHLTWKEERDVDILQVVSITPKTIKTIHHHRNGRFLNCDGAALMVDPSRQIMRLATPKEIAEVTKPKLPAQITLTLGTSNIKITVYKDGNVEAEGKSGTIKIVKQLIVQMESTTPFIAGWDSTYTTIKIGCSTFTLDELKQIVTAHDKLNELEW